MTATDLERAYRRQLRWYPQEFRREHEAEILGVLVAGAREGGRRPELMECLDLATGIVVRLVELVAVAFLFHMNMAVSEPGAGRINPTG